MMPRKSASRANASIGMIRLSRESCSLYACVKQRIIGSKTD